MGAQPNSTDNDGNTGLRILAKNDQIFTSPSIIMLHKAGAHIDKRNFWGETMESIIFDLNGQNSKLIAMANALEFPMLQCLCARVICRDFRFFHYYLDHFCLN